MELIPQKSTGDSLSATEYNNTDSDQMNLITSAGITLSGLDLYQIAKAVASYSSLVNYCVDTGAANAYVVANVGSFQSPPVYMDGMRISFLPANTNTGASTINFNSYGNITIKRNDAVTDLSAGDLQQSQFVEIIYNANNSVFTLISQPTNFSQFFTGDIKPTSRVTADSGWIMGTVLGTIGDDSSAASIRANADTQALYTYYWNNYNNSICPVQGGRLATAALDFAAHNKLQIPPFQDAVLGVAGLTFPYATHTGSTTTSISIANMPSHNHPGSILANGTSAASGGGGVVGGRGGNDTQWGLTIASQGSGTPISVMQPTFFINIMIKL